MKAAAAKATTFQPVRIAKTLDDIELDMSVLYEEVRSEAVTMKMAAELANIAGKYLKAAQLKLARDIFMRSLGSTRVEKVRALRAASRATEDA